MRRAPSGCGRGTAARRRPRPGTGRKGRRRRCRRRCLAAACGACRGPRRAPSSRRGGSARSTCRSSHIRDGANGSCCTLLHRRRRQIDEKNFIEHLLCNWHDAVEEGRKGTWLKRWWKPTAHWRTPWRSVRAGSSAPYHSSSTTSWHAWYSPRLNSATAASNEPPPAPAASSSSSSGAGRSPRAVRRRRRQRRSELARPWSWRWIGCRVGGGSLLRQISENAAVPVPPVVLVHARRDGGGPARTHAEAEAGTAMEMDERVPRTTCLGMWCPCRAVSVCGWSPPRRHATHHWRTKISYLMITSGP